MQARFSVCFTSQMRFVLSRSANITDRIHATSLLSPIFKYNDNNDKKILERS